MPLRILVVEDHAPFRHLVCAVLQRRRSGFQTIEAADGFEAVQIAEKLQPDLILLDLNLPKMHGFEVAEQIRRLAPHARLLFMSQESSPDIVRKALSLGAHGYIQKISAATDLLPGIDAVLAGQRFVSRSLAFTAPAPRRHEIQFCPDDAAIVLPVRPIYAVKGRMGRPAAQRSRGRRGPRRQPNRYRELAAPKDGQADYGRLARRRPRRGRTCSFPGSKPEVPPERWDAPR